MIVLLTDFGDSEHVGMMKGVILAADSRAQIVDLTHAVPSHSVREGAWILLESYRYFPRGGVFVGVVDPGVGGARQCVAVKTGNHFFVGPDNGLLYPAASADGIKEVVVLPTEGASPTFHGRDVFARAAAEIDMKKSLRGLGAQGSLKGILSFEQKGTSGEVVRIDRFGNVITNIPAKSGQAIFDVMMGKKRLKLPLFLSYDDAPDGKLFLVKGSAGTFEFSVRQGSAIDKISVKVGQKIEIK